MHSLLTSGYLLIHNDIIKQQISITYFLIHPIFKFKYYLQQGEKVGSTLHTFLYIFRLSVLSIPFFIIPHEYMNPILPLSISSYRKCVSNNNTPEGVVSAAGEEAGRRLGWTPRAALRSRTRGHGHHLSRSDCETPLLCVAVTAATFAVAAVACGTVSAVASPSSSHVLSSSGILLPPVNVRNELTF